MKSNQRWLKLRTTVQLSGALSSSMNRVKPPLKREDSFITRFSTRQIAELQDTVDHTDLEDDSKNFNGSANKIRRKWKKRHHRTVINPYGNAYFYWLCVLTVCVLYNLWTAIVRQSFPQLQSDYIPLWSFLDISTDLVLVLDILVQYRTGYLEQGLIVYDSEKLSLHYRDSKFFILDFIAVIPIDYLLIALQGTVVKGYHPMSRCPRFLKVYRVYNYYYMVESRTLYPNLWRVANLVHILLLLAHWFGCFYFILSETENFKGDWAYPMNATPEFAELGRQYLGSVYWSTLTLTTIGDLPTPETNRQYIFTIVSYLIGVFIFATIVGQVGNVITNRNANRLEFERLLDGAKLYMRHHKVPREMQRRVQRWYDYSWSRGRIQGGGDINSALGLLPDKLRTELALHVNLCTLKKVSIFKECQPEFLHDLVLKMKAYIFTPGDLICRKGEVAREMFIIADGILEVISETGKVLTTMKAGDFFGEIGILNLDGLNKRTADVRSVGYSELFSLSREDVLTAMKDYPEAQEILQSLGRKRLMDARHNSKSGSSSSSKHDSPSPTRENGPEEKPAKKIVSRIRSDVSAIRNAFRKSRGMTRETETVELEPLTSDARSSTETEGPAVKRLLRRLGRDGSCSSETSTGTTRGVLKRMAKVTSDESQQASSSLPGRAMSISTDEPHGVLGAGLPLIQRLKLLKDKEEREERERVKNEEDAPKSASSSSKLLQKLKVELVTEELEVIGAGLPLFARLKLLKAKEDRERMEREKNQACQVKITYSSNYGKLSVPSFSEDRNINDSAIDSDSISAAKPAVKKPAGQLRSFLRKAVLEKNSNGDQIIVPNPCEADQINDLNKETDSKIEYIGNNNTIMNKEIFSKSKVSLQTEDMQQSSECKASDDRKESTSEDESKKRSSPQKSDDSDGSQKEGVQRSDSFRRAMGEGLLGETKTDLNIPESEGNEMIKEIHKSNSSSSSAASSKRNSADSTDKNMKQSNLKSPNAEKNEMEPQDVTNLDGSLEKRSSKDEGSPEDNTAKKTTIQPNFLKVPSDEISPPLSSPESTDTPERRTLKSILKNITNQDPIIQAIHAPDLKKLMRAPTIEGFVARRSKFNKSVSFQRRTLNSPPYQAKLDEFMRRNGSSEDSRLPRNLMRQSSLGIQPLVQRHRNDKKDRSPTDGMSKLLTRLGTIGVEPNQISESEALAHGVGMILQNKMADIERAWETRLAALQQEIADRDNTIRQLTDYITHISSAVMVRQDGDGTDDDTEPAANGILRYSPSQALDGTIVVSRRRDSDQLPRSSSLDASTSGSDEDEPLFMRCTSIESIIHHSPDTSLSDRNNSLSPPPRSWPQQRVVDHRLASMPSTRQPPVRSHSIVDIGSSTDEDIYSFSSEEEHIYSEQADEFFSDVDLRDDFLNECLDDDDEEEPMDDPERGLNTDKLNSKDWEVQMLAQKLADGQREVARQVDQDIACGIFRSDLSQVHSALATENIDDLTDNDVYRLEAIVETERKHLRKFTRIYSLGERPVLEEEFCPIYRSRSQQLVSRASEFAKAGSGYEHIHKLMNTLVSLPLSEQFLLDRLLHSQERTRRLAKQRSLGDEPLSTTGAQRFAGLRVKTNTSSAFRRSQSMCSPQPSNVISPQAGPSPQRGRSPVAEVGPAGEAGPPTVSAMFSPLQRSMSTITSNSSRVGSHVLRSTSRHDTQPIPYSHR